MVTFTFEHLYFGDEQAEQTASTETQADTKTASTDSNKAESKPEKSDKDTPKYSDADLDRIIEKKFAKWAKSKQEAVDEAAKLASMTAQERAEHERDKLQKELDELKAANSRAEMEKTARGILREDGVTVSDDIVSVLVDTDADKTAAKVKAFSTAFKKAVQDEVKKQLSHKQPGGNSAGTITKSEILKETDPIKRQRLIRENIGLFKK